MKLKAAIFDVDGTLLNSSYVWTNIATKYIESKGIRPEENLEEKIRNWCMLDVGNYMVSKYKTDRTVDDVRKGVNALVCPKYMNEVLPKDGVIEMLEELHKHGVKMAIATATDKFMVDAALKRNNMYDFFDEILTCTIVGAGKENSLIYDEAMKALGGCKEDTLVFEDAVYAIRTLKNAGYKVVGVEDYDSERDKKEIIELSDYYISDYHKDIDFLKNMI